MVTTAAGWIWYLLYLVADVPVTVSAHLLTSVTGVSSWLAFFPILTSREVPQEVKRFWTLLAYAVGGLTLSNTTGAVYLVYRYDGTGTVPMRPPVWSMAALMLALLIVGWALLQLPDGMTSRAERARLILDGAVVVIAVGAFLWHFVFSGVIANADRQSTVLAAGLFAVASVVVAAVVKVMLAGTRPVSAAAVRTLGVVPLVITVSAGLEAALGYPVAVFEVLCIAPLTATIANAACFVQYRAHARATAEMPPKVRRPYSLLPFGAIVAVDALLVMKSGGLLNGTSGGVVAAAVLVTLLLALRQMLSLRAIAHMVEEIDDQRARLLHQATHDSLTGLANRALFTERLDAALERGGTDHTQVTLFLIDLDDFKTVNDTLGHGAGDELLRHVAAVLTACTRDGDLAVRFGGDEFALLITESPTSVANAERIATRLMEHLGEPITILGQQIRARASVGVAFSEPGDDTETLLRRSDTTLYAAKRQGKGVFRIAAIPAVNADVDPAAFAAAPQ